MPPLTRWTLLFAWFVLLQTAPVIAFGILAPVPLVWVGIWVRDFWTGGPSERPSDGLAIGVADLRHKLGREPGWLSREGKN